MHAMARSFVLFIFLILVLFTHQRDIQLEDLDEYVRKRVERFIVILEQLNCNGLTTKLHILTKKVTYNAQHI